MDEKKSERIEHHLQQPTIAKKEVDRAEDLKRACEGPIDFKQAINYHQQQLCIAKEIGDKTGEGVAYRDLGNAYYDHCDFKQALENHEQHLVIAKELGDRAAEGRACCALGRANEDLGNFKQALEYNNQHLSIAKEMGDRWGEECAYGGLGRAYKGLSNFKQALENHEQHLVIAKELGDRAAEGRACCALGRANEDLGNFKQALEYNNQHLSIAKEMGDRWGEECAYGGLGRAYKGLSNFKQALENHEQHLVIAKELGDRAAEGRACCALGRANEDLGNFKQALEYHNQQLSIAKEMGDRWVEGCAYGGLGRAYKGLGNLKQALENHEQHLVIAKELGDRAAEGRACCALGRANEDLGNFKQALEYHEQHLSIAKEKGDKREQGLAYGRLGICCNSLGDFKQAIEYHTQQLRFAKEVENKGDELSSYCSLGKCYQDLRDFNQAIEYHKQHLDLAKEGGSRDQEACACYSLGQDFELSNCLHEALDFYRSSVMAYNDMRCLLRGEDVWKINFRHINQRAYTALWRTLVRLSKTNEALCAAEQGRAQALTDLMKLKYGLELLPSKSRDLEKTLSSIVSEVSTQIVFVALEGKKINLWVICKGNDVQFRQNDIKGLNACCLLDTLVKDVFEENGVGRCVKCEDRSLKGLRKESSKRVKSSHVQRNKNPLQLLYRIIFCPIANLLHCDELIIVPDGPLCLAPFAAFVDAKSRYLSELVKIRIIPSLTSLKLIADCPEDYHSNSGALLVGDPCLKEVKNLFGKPKLTQLPNAREEVRMIGQLLKTTPLTGEEATKDEVLKRISSVALVHIAAHGEMGTGEIALSPNPERKYVIPEREDYILKITDLQAVQLRARLVVLSCCHSAEGEITPEGAVGIARAFLGAGARSVLASLWAIDDEATMEFMKSFYQHLLDGNSASVSLNLAMKCLRESEKFSGMKYWAPFVLIGDDVTLEFGEKQEKPCK